PFNVTSTVFLLLFPEEDVARRYDMQETRLSERLAKILCIPKDKLKLWAKCSYSLGEEVWKNMELRSTSSLERSTIGLDEISMCLDELAARSKFSDASLHMRHPFPRATDDILRQIYSTLSPEDAGFLTQIILQDLRPMLYPVREDHYTSALLAMNANAIQGLTKYQAMKAWDPSGRLLELSRVHFSLRDIAEAFDHGLKPEVALRKCIPIPKSIKGTSCQDVINRFSNSDRIWVETKYDGERCQIHVEVFEGKERASHITIFSKSMRDSTLDRFDLHAHICHALDLPHVPATLEMVQSQQVVRSFILDAEMVSWCKTEERVDEFRHIAHLINRTSWGARGRDHRRILQLEGKKRKEKKERSINNDSQSDIDDDEGRQLALVFFDIMFLDGKSLMDSPYAYRRSILENTIHCIRGRVMLAKRTAIDMQEAMRTLFSELCTNYEEGDVVKADESAYNDWTCQWVKLKRDYIPGLGDSVDLVVVGAGWEKERARDLRVPVSTLTTFYLGVITNKEQMVRHPGVRPEIYVYFTCSYGLGRKELEKINYTFKSSDSVEYGQLVYLSFPPNFDYDLVFFEKLRPSPSHIFLKRPALAEVLGAMFIKSPGCPCYELRFPRITKFYRSQDRSWLEGLSKLQMNDIAYETLGRIS
ncbi:DNA ligase/mRNA capping enzyme, partial [Fistulina hepatica ATCC 64428]